MGIPDHLTCFLRNLYAGQEATVRTGHGTTDWFQIGKGVHQGCVLSPSLFNFYAEYVMRNAGLDEAQARIKTAGRNINNLRYADDTTFMAESKQKLNSLENPFSNFEPVCCSMSGSNCCFLSCIQVSQETCNVVWYSHLIKNIPQFVVIHTVKGFSIVSEADFFFSIHLVFLWSTVCWQFALWFFCFL